MRALSPWFFCQWNFHLHMRLAAGLLVKDFINWPLGVRHELLFRIGELRCLLPAISAAASIAAACVLITHSAVGPGISTEHLFIIPLLETISPILRRPQTQGRHRNETHQPNKPNVPHIQHSLGSLRCSTQEQPRHLCLHLRQRSSSLYILTYSISQPCRD